jgi:hypothetical protein
MIPRRRSWGDSVREVSEIAAQRSGRGVERHRKAPEVRAEGRDGSSHAGDPRTAVSDTTETGQALADRDAWGQLTADRGAFTADRTTPVRSDDSLTECRCCRAGAADAGRIRQQGDRDHRHQHRRGRPMNPTRSHKTRLSRRPFRELRLQSGNTSRPSGCRRTDFPQPQRADPPNSCGYGSMREMWLGRDELAMNV